MSRHLAAIAAALSLPLIAARAAAADEASSPVKLSDAELDDVTAGTGPPAFVLAAGHGPPWLRTQGTLMGAQPTTQVNFVIKDVTLTFNIGPNSPVNFAAVLQLSLLSSPIQSGSATALQGG
jgi:hypothetical protein